MRGPKPLPTGEGLGVGAYRGEAGLMADLAALDMLYAAYEHAAVFTVAGQAGGREDLKLEIAGYGAGGLSIIAAF